MDSILAAYLILFILFISAIYIYSKLNNINEHLTNEELLKNMDSIHTINSAYNISLLKSASVEATDKIIAENFYPVGSIFLTMNIVRPNELLGFGTWTQIEDCFLFCVSRHSFSSSDSKLIRSIGIKAEDVVRSNKYINCYGWQRTA